MFFGQFDGAGAYACVWEIIGAYDIHLYYKFP